MPAIKKPNEHFDTTLWTGDGAQTRSLTGLNFQPDFTWMKSRSINQEHQLYDVVRGVGGGKMLCSNQTAVEGQDGSGNSDSQYGYLSSFDSAGFSVNDGSVATTGGWVNSASVTYGAWNWKAGGTAVTNNDGTITSQVSANPTAGFSIVTYSGNGTSGETVGHGLGVTPSMVIFKGRNASTASSNWLTWHRSISQAVQTSTTIGLTGFTGAVYLNLTNASSTYGLDPQINGSGGTYVAYCFAQVAGYSAFGSYTGNGSSDGPFIYTGFRPRYVMIKRTDSADHWTIQDTSRDTYNVSGLRLYPNQSVAEDTSPSSTAYIDMLSNGFKIRTSDSQKNASGGTYIYYAVAENPFKFSNAR